MRKTLMVICSVLWLAAGVNVVRMGLIAQRASQLGVIPTVAGIIGVFAIFGVMFFRISAKNIKRIHALPQDKLKVWNCMPVKSFLIMAFMITLGVCLRRNEAVPRGFIAFFYIGLGSALSLAGLLYLVRLFFPARARQS